MEGFAFSAPAPPHAGGTPALPQAMPLKRRTDHSMVNSTRNKLNHHHLSQSGLCRYSILAGGGVPNTPDSCGDFSEIENVFPPEMLARLAINSGLARRSAISRSPDSQTKSCRSSPSFFPFQLAVAVTV